MFTYLAGVPGGGSPGLCKRERELNHLWKSRLWTYYWLKGIEMPQNKKVNLFLDSGAFSAWSQKIEINIYDYIDFIKRHQDVIDVYVNLDVIGDAKRTLKNQRIMEQQGLSPIPVFHLSEPEKYLAFYVRNYEYIGLGGSVGMSTEQIMLRLDQIFPDFICDSDGYPKVKVHGFGLTSLRLMLRYPWYSVDSTSWVVTGRLGSIYVPQFRNGNWFYDCNPWKVAISTRSPCVKEAGKHISTFSPKRRQIILNYIHQKGYRLGKSEFKYVNQTHEPKENEHWVGKKPKNKNDKRLLEIIQEPGVSNCYQLRDELNIIYFLDLEESMPKWPWPFRKKSRRLL